MYGRSNTSLLPTPPQMGGWVGGWGEIGTPIQRAWATISEWSRIKCREQNKGAKAPGTKVDAPNDRDFWQNVEIGRVLHLFVWEVLRKVLLARGGRVEEEEEAGE